MHTCILHNSLVVLLTLLRLLQITCLHLVLAMLVSSVWKAERATILIVSIAIHVVFPPTRYVLLSLLETNQQRNFKGPPPRGYMIYFMLLAFVSTVRYAKLRHKLQFLVHLLTLRHQLSLTIYSQALTA